ncbi:RNA polymerase-binding protein RbpA [Trueperella pecoris]|uniref:RNA polymerase-binding protein RbpA n=1 Tax=Trueperella pecoris TaxID=2733571 RepID=A0A7M1QXJ7_9ACTO|nr:RNA polymerase-binding protein RbpA [Trueperella pecoris]QOQ38834.1 RNA polymerase-binding protein RbpA [Trueperella pecoris]QOR46541.1 RNA polymerase-binding protein RbpA [Trueperella pecoris]
MAERSLRGMKIGAHSLESDSGVAFVARREESYRCEDGHTFTVTFAEDAEAPLTWECKCGKPAELIGGGDNEEESKQAKPQRTHWDMLLERRSEEELKVLLEERLELLRTGRLYKRRR